MSRRIARVVLLILGASMSDAAHADEPAPAKATELYEATRVWSAHLSLPADQWKAMEPAGGRGILSLFTSGRDAASASARTNLLASTMLKRGDRNADAALDRDEFLALADKWFTQWDAPQSGALDQKSLQEGLNSSLDPEGALQGGAFPFSLRGEEGKRNGLAAILGLEMPYVRGKIEFQGKTLDNVAIRYKGNGTFVEARSSIKRPFKVDLNEFAKGQKLAGINKLNFHNSVADPGFMNETLAYRLYRDAGVPSPRTAYAKVFVTVPSTHDRKYFGLYTLVENVDDDFAKDRFGTKNGALFKPVTFGLFADLGDDWAAYKQSYDPKTEASSAQTQRVIQFAKLVTRADDAEFAARLGEFLDLDNFARYMAVTVYLSALDSILMVGQNYYLHLHPQTHRFQFIAWDQDHSFGHLFGDQEQLARMDIHKPWMGPNRFLQRVFAVEEFKKLYLQHLARFSENIFKPARLHQQVDETAAVIRPAILEESKDKASRFDEIVKGKPTRAALFFTRNVNSIKRFVDLRAPSINDQLAGKSASGPINTGMGNQNGQSRGGPGGAFAPLFVSAMDADKDGRVTRDEFVQQSGRWFSAWDVDRTGALTSDQLRAGVTRDLLPRPPATRPAAASQPATAPAASRKE